MALDGLNLVMSRVALLDIFLMFFILLSFYFLIKEQIWLSGLTIGLAAATKWSAVFLIPFLLLLTINMRIIEPMKWLKRLSQFVFLPAVIYLISWSGWLLTNTGWSRDSTSNPITSLLHYHGEILDFHQGLVEKHAYSANPWSWLILGRPTSFFYESPSNCGAASCAQEILAIGTPILWWSAIFGVAVTVGFFIVKRERVAAIILAGFAGTYLPWFFMQSRTMFYFYAISILPFLILALIYCFKQLLTLGKYEKQISLFVLLVGLNFLFFLPILLGVEIPYSQWLSRMWLPSWI
jgi:dolichyl-phosphate-mannose--protein O-mannosyl transferase